MAVNLKDLPADPPSTQNNVFQAEVDAARRERTAAPTDRPDVQNPVYSAATSQQGYIPPSSGSGGFKGVLTAFNAFSTGGNKAVLWRRLCLILILLIRTTESALSIYVYHNSTARLVINIILFILGFFVVAYLLSKIGEMRGNRKLFRWTVGRWHFDVFLVVMTVLHIFLLVGMFVFLRWSTAGILWIFFWLLIWLAAWVATKPPVGDGSMA